MKSILLASAASLILFGAGCAKPASTDAETPIPTVSMDTPEKTIDAVAADASADLKVSFGPVQSNGDMWWVMPDQKNVFIEKVPGRPASLGEAPQESGSPSRSYGAQTQALASRVDRFLLANGFQKDALNSSKDLHDESFYDVVQAYQKDKIICTFVIDGDSYETTNVNFMCTDTDKLSAAYTTQLPYLNAIQNTFSTTSFSNDSNVVISRIQTFPPLFAVVNINHRRTGYFAILKKIKGAYQQVFAGQEAPECKIVDKYLIPKAVVGECYVNATTLRKNTH